MFKHYLTTSENVDFFGLLSLLIFFLVFAAVILWVIKMKKSYINEMSNLPLEKDEEAYSNEFKSSSDE